MWNLANLEKLIVHLHWFVKTIQWFLPLTWCHFQPRVTEVTRGWKWHLVRDKNHFIFLTPVTVNKYSLFRFGGIFTFWLLVFAGFTGAAVEIFSIPDLFRTAKVKISAWKKKYLPQLNCGMDDSPLKKGAKTTIFRIVPRKSAISGIRPPVFLSVLPMNQLRYFRSVDCFWKFDAKTPHKKLFTVLARLWSERQPAENGCCKMATFY